MAKERFARPVGPASPAPIFLTRIMYGVGLREPRIIIEEPVTIDIRAQQPVTNLYPFFHFPVVYRHHQKNAHCLDTSEKIRGT
jgi:hypothetical protein